MPDSFKYPMRRDVKARVLFALLFAVLLCTVRCNSLVKISDVAVCPLEDPFTGEGYCVNVISGKETVIPREEWRMKRRNYILLSPEAWAQIKKDNYQNCYTNECEHVLDNIDQLFLSIDKAVKAAGVLR